MRRLTQHLRSLLRPSAAPEVRDRWLFSIGVFTGVSPLHLDPDPRFPGAVLTRDHVTDVPAAFVADPFLACVAGTWHMFFEVFNLRTRRGEIGLATSSDLASWTYQQVVLAEPFHLSYPHVFEWDAAHYMVPETHQTGTIRLYRADPFPGRWRLVHTLISGSPFADSTLFRHDGRWWLLTEAGGHSDMLRLYHATDLFGRWTEHPSSPVVEEDLRTARPAGPVVQVGGALYRFAQDCASSYGLSVSGFEIAELTTTEYVERPAGASPILAGGREEWNAGGMHHLDAHCLGPERWIAAVDGWRRVTAAEFTRRS
ncbi:MAG: glucosamine inositolphosphorylceramide transferase family protein [Gemmatimonadales bacterium]